VRRGGSGRFSPGVAVWVPECAMVLLLFLLFLMAACSPEFDLVLEGGRVVDGTGRPSRSADIGIRDGTIRSMGNLAGRSTARRINVSGLVVAPGFVDVHSHAAPALETEALAPAEPLLRQGITTVLVNPDGSGAVDLWEQRSRIEAQGPGVNVAQLVPHGSVRRQVLGMVNRQASTEELDSMRTLVRKGMKAGAFGLSSGLFYAPGSFADLSEVIELGRVVAETGGLYASHIRDESDYTIGVVAAVEEVITVAREAHITGIVTHIKALGPNVWGSSEEVVRRIEAARAAGIDVWADQYPYEASATGLTSALVPRDDLSGGFDSLMVRLDAEPARLRRGIAQNLARRGGADRIQFRRFQADPSIEGRTLADVAGARGQDAVETALELIRAGGAGIVSHNMSPIDVERFMKQPWVMTSSDGGLVPMGEGVPHPRNYGSFPRKLALYVAERGVMDLESAVRSMTGLPADVMQLEGRGYLCEGFVADLVVFDPGRIRDRATYTEPHQLSEGIDLVLLGGQVALRGEALSAERWGRVLKARRASGGAGC
jgi:N-acyl-D-amino-acid deacylase